MNGMDWPSPTANLLNVEEQIKKILAATGVDVPSLAPGGSSPAALPLPLAAFASLTITYKDDRASELCLNLAGQTLEFFAAGCDSATWRAYVSGFVTLMVGCAPNWVLDVDIDVLKRLSTRLRQLKEEELALALLGVAGLGTNTMGAATELIIDSEMYTYSLLCEHLCLIG